MTASRDARRRPAAADASLWARATADVKPLPPARKRRRRNPPPVPPPGPETPPAPVAAMPAPPVPAIADTRVAAPAARGNAGLDRRTLARLKRGDITPAARLDLHGMTQAEAHAALDDFIDRAVRRGARLVLAITGKGSGGDGVLRRMLPRWIQSGPHAGRILRVEHAHARHGGEGAWYVYLRRVRRETDA
jgi:DNA-nicking Smr family endonuclease